MNKNKKKIINNLIKDYYLCRKPQQEDEFLIKQILSKTDNISDRKKVINFCNKQLRIIDFKLYLESIIFILPLLLLPLLFKLSFKIAYKILPPEQLEIVKTIHGIILLFLIIMILLFKYSILKLNNKSSIIYAQPNKFYIHQTRLKMLRDALLLKIYHYNNHCSSCKNYHGKIYEGNVLICGIHPFGQENCPDFE